jgi:hypothetical protein
MPYVPGAVVHGVVHVADVYRSNNVYVNNVPVALWDQPGPTSAIIGNIYIPDNPFQASLVSPIVSEAGANAFNDDDEGTDIPGFTSIDIINANSKESTTSTSIISSETVEPKQGIDVDGKFSDTVDYDQKLSPNFAVRDVSIGTIFPHNIIAQNGLSIPDILKNLQAIAVNILEPLRSQYPGFRINSGFRKGPGTSQHNKGMAVDIQWPGIGNNVYTDRGRWVADNLPIDQLIFEHGNSIWLHISYNRTAPSQRGKLTTYYPRGTPKYTPGLTNYYA